MCRPVASGAKKRNRVDEKNGDRIRRAVFGGLLGAATDCRRTVGDAKQPHKLFGYPLHGRTFCRIDPSSHIDLVIELAIDIIARNPDIAPVDVIGHSDIAPDRRVDPGPKFPWKRLYENGIGAWYDDETRDRYRRQFEVFPPQIGLLQQALDAYGYLVENSGINDDQTRFAVRAFQLHFRPDSYSGEVDAETAAILFSLLEKYRPKALRGLLQLDSKSAPSALD